MTLYEGIQSAASIATAVAVFLAAWQLWLTKRQAVVQFEDDLVEQYRNLLGVLPVEALLGEPLDDSKHKDALQQFYRYIDLTNEQIFLRMSGRVTKSTWLNWSDGIRSNLGRPAFVRAWQEVKERSPKSFMELRRLENERFESDPRSWR